MKDTVTKLQSNDIFKIQNYQMPAYSQQGGTTWQASQDILVINSHEESVIKHTGPIWGNYEADSKVKRFMREEGMNAWEWTGHWNSEGGTSYAQFKRKIQPDDIININLLQQFDLELSKNMENMSDLEALLEKECEIRNMILSIQNSLLDFEKSTENTTPSTIRSEMSELENQLFEFQKSDLLTNCKSVLDSTLNCFIENDLTTNWAQLANKHSILVVNDKKVEQVIKNVGKIEPLLVGSYIRAFIEQSGMLNWSWTGEYKSEGGTTYAKFICNIQPTQTL